MNLRETVAWLRPVGWGWMWRGVNTLAVLVLLAGSAAGQTVASPPADTVVLDERPIDPLLGFDAHVAVSDWVRRADLNGATVPITVRGLLGVKITLRMDGVVMGSAEAYPANIDASISGEQTVELYGLLRTATERAMDGVRRRLDDARSAAIAAERLDAAAVPTMLADVAPRLLVDVQLAYGVEPVRLAPGSDLAAALLAFVPGHHGLWVPAGAGARGAGAIVWPGTALATNLQPQHQLAGVLTQAGVGPGQTAQIGGPGGLPLQRFEVVQVVRPALDLPPMHLVRGSRDLPLRNLNDAEIADLLRNMGDLLGRRLIAGQLVRGTYHPSTGRYDPALAEPDEAALALYALSRVLQVRRLDDHAIDPLVQQRLARTTRRMVEEALADERFDLARGGLLLMAVLRQPILTSEHDLREQLERRLVSLQREPGQFAASSAADAGLAGQAGQAIAAASLAGVYELTRRPDIGEALAATLDRLEQDLVDRPSLSSLYWVALAHDQVYRLMPDHAALWQRLGGTLRQLVDQLARRQIVEPPAFGPDDVVGAFSLDETPPGAAPAPTWHSSQGVAVLAVALRDPAVHAPADRLGWLLTAGLGARFLDLLTLGPASAYYTQSRADSIGGLRLSLYDNRLATAPVAMGAIAVAELQSALRWSAGANDPLLDRRAEPAQPEPAVEP